MCMEVGGMETGCECVCVWVYVGGWVSEYNSSMY